MPKQFEKANNQEQELSKINPRKVNIPKPIELTPEQDENLLDLAIKARTAEKQGDLKTAVGFYQKYKEQYSKLKGDKEKEEQSIETENDQEFQEKALEYIQTLLDQGADKDYIAQGLAGLDSEKAWEMRETLLSQGADKGWVAQGVYGDYLMAGFRKARRDRAEKE